MLRLDDQEWMQAAPPDGRLLNVLPIPLRTAQR
jgi:hypothetical protein